MYNYYIKDMTSVFSVAMLSESIAVFNILSKESKAHRRGIYRGNSDVHINTSRKAAP